MMSAFLARSDCELNENGGGMLRDPYRRGHVHFWTDQCQRCSWINRYSLRIFFSQYWPRDYNLRKRFFEVSSYTRAFARMNYEVADGKFFLEYRVACLRKKSMADNSKMKTVLCKVEAERANLKTWSVEKWWVARPSSQKSEKQWFLHFADELVVFCPLTSFQEDVYQTLLQNSDVELITKKNFPCDCGSGVDRGKCCYKVNTIECAQYTVTC